MDLGLKNRVALVTGGSRGLGRAVCVGLAEEGARVAANFIRTDPEPWLAELRARLGCKCVGVRGDVSKSEEVHAVFDAAEAALGPIEILVNNAGVWPKALVKDMSVEEWNAGLTANLTSAFLACREAVRRWLDRGQQGRIVNITSQAAYQGATTGHAHYAAAKAGLVNLTVSLARETAPHGIRVNSVAPGFMRTDMVTEAWRDNSQRYLDRIPLGRIADPAEVAAAVLFLVSDRASYMTGASLHVNGGMLMH